MTKANALNADLTTLLGGRVQLLQPKAGLRAGLDAVMVAAACPAGAGDMVLDLGCGTGGAGFSVMARIADVCLVGVDIQGELLDLARQNAALNGWADRCAFVEGDVRNKALLQADYFDHAVCNPPYMQAGTWFDTPDNVRSKQLGMAEGDAVLQDWVDCLQRVVKPKGSVSLVHRADHLDKVIQALGTRFGAVEIWPLYAFEGEAANRVVVRARKNRKSPCVVYQGIVLHGADKAWTPKANAILEEAGALT